MKNTGRRIPPLLLALTCTGLAAAAHAAPGWLLATPGETVRAGERIEVDVVRPDEGGAWPETLSLRVQRPNGMATEIELQPADAGGAQRRGYTAQLPKDADGVLRVELAGLASNRLALIAAAAAGGDAIGRLVAPEVTDPERGTNGGLRFDPVPDDEPALSANEPMYIVAGARDGLDARFQLSFKFRPFDPRSLPARTLPFLGRMHFGYTQTSLWDLHRDSKPFRDTSYRPSLFWQGRINADGGLAPSFLRGGYEHESNGKDGDKSRSIDTLFVQPAWRRDFADGRTLIFAPKFFSYLERDDNRDIARYRGYADWVLRYGDESGWVLATRLRRGTAGHGSAQIDLSHPLREPLFSRVGGFLHLQVFTGYGETLLDYDVKRPPQFRIGFSIVR